MFLYVASTKVITHFNDNDKGLKVYRQETKNAEVTSTALPDTSPLSDATREVFQLKNILYLALTVIKRSWVKSHSYTYLFLITEN